MQGSYVHIFLANTYTSSECIVHDINNLHICISCNTGKSALPDIYTRRPQAHSARGYIYIYIQTYIYTHIYIHIYM